MHTEAAVLTKSQSTRLSPGLLLLLKTVVNIDSKPYPQMSQKRAGEPGLFIIQPIYRMPPSRVTSWNSRSPFTALILVLRAVK